MYLKSIEIQGFKSFANKIVFEFHNGITGIVGPNGSGKSNVADAVRWVLGEQRVKQLRGASMQDVIFSGTETRKPQGFAYVAITLDNSDHKLAIDFDQVTVSRRIYRSGESEYLLNGSPCRLKDINELFYDTGIGKEGYSIIGQGQIDKILSGRPEERRELFDEAAGIVKFKRRKAVAQKKLEDEKQNLVRVSDILSELEKQVGPLKKQSETAREYLRLKEELKRHDVNMFLAETAVLRSQAAELEEKIAAVTADMEESRAEADAARKQQDGLEEEIRVLDEKILSGRNAGSEARMNAGAMEGQIQVLKEQIRAEEMNEEHIRQRIASIEGEVSDREVKKQGFLQEIEGLSGRKQEMVSALEEAEELLSLWTGKTAELEHKIEEAKAGIIGALNEKSEFSVKRQRYDTMLEQVQVRRSEVAQKLLKVRSDEEHRELQIREQEAKKQAAGGAIAALLERSGQLEEAIREASEETARLNRNLNNTQQEYHKVSTRLESLRNLAERYEGYGNSIRKVMEVRDRVRGIHGVVADLLEVPKEYETAIETALGGSIQNIVTDSEETAKVLIGYLKKNQYGRATFLPLSAVSGRGGFEQKQALKEPGAIGLASSLVKADSRYSGLVEYLLGRVLVADNIDNAIAIARKYRHSFRIVTPSGELLSPGGSMSGGAFRNSSNLLGRRREMEELEKQCTGALVQVDRIQKELVLQETAVREKTEELEQVKKDLQSRYLEENTIVMELRQLEKNQADLQESFADMDLENRQLEGQMRDIRNELEKIAEKIRELEETDGRKNQEIDGYSKRLEEAKEKREEAVQSLAEVQLQAASLKQQESFLLQNVERLTEEAARLQEERESLRGTTGQSRDAVEEKNLRIQDLLIKIGEENKKAEEVSAETDRAISEKEEKGKLRKQLSERKDELSDRISRLDKESFRLHNQKEKQEERQEGLVNYMWSEYELTYSTAEALRDENAPAVPELKRRIQELKNQIRDLGNVNVNAIEDYKEISERYEFMKSQHDDLTAAADALYKIIEELDAGMRRQFSEKFAEIRREFDRVFRELFGGGHGSLELVENEDLLEAGIQIISQPPGKKLQNMMQMSGGEKALTAIALLFAIQNLKPSPFCLLDEIEAALDDSNVDRFARYLHKLTRSTQFIVITHRRGTMVASDRLYGITMQEKGVSTLVSVNLIENDLEN